MLTLKEFERVYPHRSRARSKYVSALFRFGKYGGVTSFGNGTKRPGDELEGGDAKRTTVHPPALFDPSQVDDFGFVKSLDLHTCDVPPEMARYLPSVELAGLIKTLYKRTQDSVIPMVEAREERMEERHALSNVYSPPHHPPFEFEADNDILHLIALFRQVSGINLSFFFSQPSTVLDFITRPDMSFPVYLRDHCSSKSIRELRVCVPRVYYHFGARGIQTEPLLIYLNRVPGFQRLFPYRIMSSRAGNLFEVSARDFFTNDNVDVAQYSIKTKADASGEHGLHARFAVKDRARRRIVLFDPHGHFGVKDKYDPDFSTLNRVFRSITEGIRVKVVKSVDANRTDVKFYGYPELHGFLETIKNVHVSTLFGLSGEVISADAIEVGKWYTHKLPTESVHGFTGVDRATDEAGYEGDQPTEGTCALVSLMRTGYIAQQMHLRPLDNPIRFVRDDIPCHFAVFISMLAQSLSVDDDNFNEDMLDLGYGQGIFVRVVGIQDSVWVYRLPTRKTMVPALKVVRMALSRVAMTRSVSMNPYKYRIKLVYPHGALGVVGVVDGVRYVPIDAKVDMTCVDAEEEGDDDECAVEIEPLPVNTYNVSIFVKRAHSPIEHMQEVIMTSSFAHTKFVRDMSVFLTPPFNPDQMLVVMQVGKKLLTGDSRIVPYFDPSTPGSRPEIRLIEKPRMIQVMGPGGKTWSIRIDNNTRVHHIIDQIRSDIHETCNIQLTYEGRPRREYIRDVNTRVSTLNTEQRFEIVKLHVLPSNAHVVVRYLTCAYEPFQGPTNPDQIREVQVPVGPKTTINDVKRKFNKLVTDQISRNNRLTTSFDSFDDVASDSVTVYPDFDRLTLYYF
jgi:hypothetical protein